MDLVFFARLMNGLLMIGMPVALGVFLARRFRLGWRLWWIGAATFVLSQVGHIPFNWMLTQMFKVGILPNPPAAWSPYFNPIVLGLSAGLWEELTRAGVYRWWADDARSWRKGVFLGAGHGGIEAIILGLILLFTFVQLAALRGADLSRVVPPEHLALAQQQVSEYWSLPWSQALLGAVERFFTIPVHIAFSVLVLQAFTRRQWWWVALAVLYHALVDGVVVYLMGLWRGEPWAMYAVEGVIGGFALLSVMIIFALRRPEPVAPEEPAPVSEPAAPLSAADLPPQDVKIDLEKLDDSRYS